MRHERKRDGGIFHLLFALAVLAGLVFGIGRGDDHPLPAEVTQTENCQPVEAGPASAQALLDVGWEPVGALMYPPGCESVR